MTLRDYQIVGSSFLASQDGALLADQMGLGKTIQAITSLQLLAEKNELDRALIIAPAALQTNWMDEFKTWAPEMPVMRLTGDFEDRLASYSLPVMVQIVTYDQIRIDAISIPSNVFFDVVLLDEAQRIKNMNSRTALACRMLRRKRSWALTGTPLENSTSDIKSLFAFIKPRLLGPNDAPSQIHNSIKPYVLRRHIADVVPELPKLIDQTLRLELTSQQRSIYDETFFAFGEKHSSYASNSSLFELLTELKQICNFDPSSNSSCKLDALETILDECESNGNKVIIFSQYVTTLNWLAQRIHPQSFIFHGGLSKEQKDSTIERFKESADGSVLLMSLKAGGVGLNLQEASVVVLYDRWWNPASESQAVSRAHRMGQKQPVLVYRFLVRDTVEERIQSLLSDKLSLFEMHVDSLAHDTPLRESTLRRILAVR